MQREKFSGVEIACSHNLASAQPLRKYLPSIDFIALEYTAPALSTTFLGLTALIEIRTSCDSLFVLNCKQGSLGHKAYIPWYEYAAADLETGQ